MASTNFSITFPEELLLAVDKQRGKMPRATYLAILTEEKLVKLGVYKSK